MSGYPDEARLPNVIRASRLHLILAEWIGLKISRQRVNQWIHQGVRGYVLAAEKRPDPARPSAEILVVRGKTCVNSCAMRWVSRLCALR